MSPQLLEHPTVALAPAPGPEERATPMSRTVDEEPGRLVFWRRRAMVVLSLLAVAFLLTGLISRVGAEAELENKVAGHVVVQPGETLWDVAVATAPTGMDAREHLAAVRELNDLDRSHVDAWTVVLIPAR